MHMSIDQEPKVIHEDASAFQKEEAVIRETYPQGLEPEIRAMVVESYREVMGSESGKEKTENTMWLVYKMIGKFRNAILLQPQEKRWNYFIDSLKPLIEVSSKEPELISYNFVPEELMEEPHRQVFTRLAPRFVKSNGIRDYFLSLLDPRQRELADFAKFGQEE